MENQTFRIQKRYWTSFCLSIDAIVLLYSFIQVQMNLCLSTVVVSISWNLFGISVALQFPEGLLLYACVISDIIERYWKFDNLCFSYYIFFILLFLYYWDFFFIKWPLSVFSQFYRGRNSDNGRRHLWSMLCWWLHCEVIGMWFDGALWAQLFRYDLSMNIWNILSLKCYFDFLILWDFMAVSLQKDVKQYSDYKKLDCIDCLAKHHNEAYAPYIK